MILLSQLGTIGNNLVNRIRQELNGKISQPLLLVFIIS